MEIEETIAKLQKLVDLNKNRTSVTEAVEMSVKTLESAVDYLNTYKKALELTCNIIENNAYCPYMCDGNRSCIDCILQKAREE